MARFIYRSSITGEIVSAEYAERHPDTTQREELDDDATPQMPKFKVAMTIEGREDVLWEDAVVVEAPSLMLSLEAAVNTPTFADAPCQPDDDPSIAAINVRFERL
jgi:hypothetical protein